ncbi:MAG: hypothetical protein HEEMFOPI_01862 [Holosporales bacterium]
MTRKRPTQSGVKMKKPVAIMITTSVENIFGPKFFMIEFFSVVFIVYQKFVNFWLRKKQKHKITKQVIAQMTKVEKYTSDFCAIEGKFVHSLWAYCLSKSNLLRIYSLKK